MSIKYQEYNWHQVRDSVLKADSHLAQILDDWDPGKEYTFIELSYPYGTHILDVCNGGYQLPLEKGNTISIQDPKVTPLLKKQLGYRYLPLGIITRGGAEVYQKVADNRIFSLAYLPWGINVGIWELFAPPAHYSVTSGARSMMMVPKITDAESHRKLRKEFKLSLPPPREASDQWQVFTEIAQSLATPWETKILFLNAKWLEPQKKNAGWLNFYNYLYQKAWEHTIYARTKTVVLEINWRHFCNSLKEKGARFDPYLLETMRHIILVSLGVIPAFAAVGTSNIYGPAEFLMNAYLESYQLKQYVPTLLAPAHFGRTFDQTVPVYYSFQQPSLLESIPKAKSFSSAIEDLRDFKILMDTFMQKNLDDWQRFNNESLQIMRQNTQFDYFHSEMHTYGGIQPTMELIEKDSNLMYMPGSAGSRIFADKASFFRCCLRISKRETQK